MIVFIFLFSLIPLFGFSEELYPSGLNFSSTSVIPAKAGTQIRSKSSSRTDIVESSEELSTKKESIDFQVESEGAVSKNPISLNNKQFYPNISYVGFNVLYSRNGQLNFFVDLSFESQENEWTFVLDEWSVSYNFDFIPLDIKVGWLFLNLGYMEKNHKVFFRDLSLYSVLTRNQKDIGALLELYIWEKFLSLQASYFRAWSYRESDLSYKPPEQNLFVVKVKTQGAFWDGFISWFERDLAFFDPFQALGAGVELKGTYKELGLGVQSEFWRVTEKGQTTFTYYILPKLSINKLSMGVVFGDMNRFSPDLKSVKSSMYERVFQLSYQVHPNVLLMGERFISKQKEGLLTNDLWALRVQAQFDWSTEF